ncbi:MAG: DEAD/DEAH box helicase [Verrucomicrobia bacterium]|nr:DEAD/DEAH box helicase [Verrucomicrobiota bacterium]
MIRLNEFDGAEKTGGDDLIENVRHFFSPTGPLSRFKVFEYRPQQQSMAVKVAEALVARRNLVVEAGTGVGKSLAYLVPSILYAKQAGRKAIISTNTINLQEQLCFKDLPLLQELLEIPFQFLLLKGRQNYLCRLRLHRARRMADRIFTTSEILELQRIYEWSKSSEDGSLSDLAIEPDSKVWAQVCSERGICAPRKCGAGTRFADENGQCHYQAVRSQILSSDVLVLNHTLFFVHLGGIQEERNAEGILFKNDFVIFDEAHTVESVASKHVGMSLTSGHVRYTLHRLWNPRTLKGLVTATTETSITRKVSDLLESVDHFFSAVEEACDALAGDRDSTPASTSGDDGEMESRMWKEIRIRRPELVADSLSLDIHHLCAELQELVQASDERSWAEEIQEAKKRLLEIQKLLVDFLRQEPSNFVYWVERTGRHQKNFSLNSAPADIAEFLKARLFLSGTSVVMTSATLSTTEEKSIGTDSVFPSGNKSIGRGLRYFCNRIGAARLECAQVGSPFDYARQAKLYVVQQMPDPRSREYSTELGRWITHFVSMTGGKAFVLFTSSHLLNRVADRIQGEIESAGFPCLIQGRGTPRSTMLELFKSNGKSVLFGLDSFWQGVDVPGEALSNVILTRLPFSVPDHPLIEAKLEFIEARGGNPFFEYSLPEAVLKFRQGFGRLIRSSTDKGIVVVLDNRILTKKYGQMFLDSLPEVPVEIV